MAERDSRSFLANSDLYFQWGHDTKFEFIFQGDKSIGLLIQWRNIEDAGRAAAIAHGMKIFVPKIYSGGGRQGTKVRLIWAITVPERAARHILGPGGTSRPGVRACRSRR